MAKPYSMDLRERVVGLGPLLGPGRAGRCCRLGRDRAAELDASRLGCRQCRLGALRRATRKHYSAEEKIRIVLDGLRGEASIAELCRKEGIAEGLYYSWSKEFLEAGKRRLPPRRDRMRYVESARHKMVRSGPAIMPLACRYEHQSKLDGGGRGVRGLGGSR
jgi:transposase-like protein